MFCRECGTKNEDHAKFCKNCGSPLNQNKVSETIQVDTKKVRQNFNKKSETGAKIAYNSKNNNNSNVKIIAIVVIAFIILCVVGVAIFTVTSTFLSHKNVTIDGITFKVPNDFEIVNSTENLQNKALGYYYDENGKTLKRIKDGDEEELKITVQRFEDSYTAEEYLVTVKNQFIQNEIDLYKLTYKNTTGYGNLGTLYDLFMYSYGNQVIFISYEGKESDMIKNILSR